MFNHNEPTSLKLHLMDVSALRLAFFCKGINVSVKPATSIDEQIALLSSRGMIIDNEEKARYYLNFIGYYRLSGYWFKFQEKYLKTGKTSVSEQFVVPVNFDDILHIYSFDRELRQVFMDAFERIEVAARCVISNYCSTAFEPLWYLDPKYFNDLSNISHSELIRAFQKIFEHSDALFVKKFKIKHPNQMLPSWKMFEIIFFGDVAKLYSMLNNNYHRKKIAEQFNVSVEVFDSALKVFSQARNVCAHYSRFCPGVI